MAAFAAGRADVLVATTVIEVGIDVAQRDRDADRERRALRYLPAAPAARQGRARGAPRAVLPRRAAERGRLAAAARAGRPYGRVPARRARSRAAQARASSWAPASRGSGASGWRACPQDAQLLELARARAEAIVASDPELAAPEHVLLG